MPLAGLLMLLAVPAIMIGIGLPAFIAMIGVAVVFAAIGVLGGTIPLIWLSAMRARLVGLLESDLLQALPLFVLMGGLLNLLPLADIVFRACNVAVAAIRRRQPWPGWGWGP